MKIIISIQPDIFFWFLSPCLIQNKDKILVLFFITKTWLCNFDPLKPHFYIVKLGFTGVYIIFLILLKIHRLWVLPEAVLTSTHNLCFEKKYEKYQNFLSENFPFFGCKIFNIFE